MIIRCQKNYALLGWHNSIDFSAFINKTLIKTISLFLKNCSHFNDLLCIFLILLFKMVRKL